MPELSIIQWVGAIGAAVYAAYRAWPMVKAKLPAAKADVIQPWERERAMFECLLELTRYCTERGENKAADVMRDNVLPLLLKLPEEVPDETD